MAIREEVLTVKVGLLPPSLFWKEAGHLIQGRSKGMLQRKKNITPPLNE